MQTLIDQGLLDSAILVQKLKEGTKSNYYYVKTRPNKDQWNKLDPLQMIFGRKKHVYISGPIFHCHKKPKPLWKCKTVKLVCFATIQSTRTGLLHFLLWTSPASWFKSRISKLRGFVILFWTGRRGRLKRPGFTCRGFTFPLGRPTDRISWRCFTQHLFSFSPTQDNVH